MQQLAPSPPQPPRPIPYGLVSLWEMINFNLNDFVWTWRLMQQERTIALRQAAEQPQTALVESDLERLKANLEGITATLNALFIGEDRLGRLHTAIRLGGIRYEDVAYELNVLIEEVEDKLKYERFYHYPRAKGLLYLTVPGDWAKTLAAFKSARPDIEAGVDCFALERATASVFHMMRVAEFGLRGLAKERRVTLPPRVGPIEWATWQDLIDAIRAEARTLANSLPRGEKRDAVRDFYTGALGEFEAFKDEFRNHVMHTRKSYGDKVARDTMNHVRGFMERLSAKTNEKGKSIKWR